MLATITVVVRGVCDLQECRECRAGQQVGGLVYWEQYTAGEDEDRIESGLNLPMGLPSVDSVCDRDTDWSNEKAVVHPGIRRTAPKEDFGSKDTPENRL